MSPALLAGRTIALAGAPGFIADEILRGLIDHGAVAARPPDDGTIDGIVHVCIDRSVMVRAPLEALNPAMWDERCEALIRAGLATCRRAHAALEARGGQLVFVVPAAGLVGETDLAAYCAAFEGIRSMAKAAARQWGASGITVNCVAPAVQLFLEDPWSPRERPALNRPPTVRTEVAGAVAFLLSSAAGGVTGTTIVVDGGSIMTP